MKICGRALWPLLPLLMGFAPVPLPDITRVRDLRLPAVSFVDDAQRTRTLESLGGQPLIVVPTYTRCHGTCPRIASGLKQALLRADLDLRSYQVFLFSFDERNSSAELAAFRRDQKLPATWTLARLARKDIAALTDALDYRFSWQEGDWAHPNAIAFVSPGQRLVKFLYGVSFSPGEIRDALDAARSTTDWGTRLAPWALALGTLGLTFSVVALVHGMSVRRRAAATQTRG